MSEVNDPSGTGFYGKGYWGNKVFWRNVPVRWRGLDEYHYLELLMKTWGDSGESILEAIAALPMQRDPYTVRTRNSEVVWFYVTESIQEESSDWGPVIRLVGEREYAKMPATDPDAPPSSDAGVMSEWFPWFPYAPLSKVAFDWQLYWMNAQYDVVNVRSRNFDQSSIFQDDSSLANEVWVKGGDLRLVFDYVTNRRWDVSISDDPVQGVVKVGVTDGSFSPEVRLPVTPVRLQRGDGSSSVEGSAVRLLIPAEVGSPTDHYLHDIPVDEDTGTLNLEVAGVVSGTVCGTINYLSGQITIDLTSAFPSSSLVLDIHAKYKVRGYYMKFNAPPLIGYLARDFGFENDENDPEDVQRSSIANITKFWGIKATYDSYRIRGEISLFDVQMQGLFRVNQIAMAQQIPEDSRFEIVRGSGVVIYTDTQPLFLRYDHINSDQQFWDARIGMDLEVPPQYPAWTPLVDNMLLVKNSSRWDGMSIGLAFAVDVAQGYYGKVSPTNSSSRGPVTVDSVRQVNQDERDLYKIANGYVFELRMKRCQWDAFNFPLNGSFQSPAIFGMSQYIYNADPTLGVPPGPDDDLLYIDIQQSAWGMDTPGATTSEDSGIWTVIVGMGVDVVTPPIPSGADVAIRYMPPSDAMSCEYCRSNVIRAIVTVTDAAYEFYDSAEKVDLAIQRLKLKLEDLKPIHVQIVEWMVTRRYELEMLGVRSGASVWREIPEQVHSGAVKVLVTVEFKGDADGPTKAVDFKVLSDNGSGWNTPWSELGWTGGADPDVWETVASDVELDLDEVSEYQMMAVAECQAATSSGSVRWTFKTTRRE